MTDSNSHDHITTCPHCGEPYDLRLLSEVWVHEHTRADIPVDASITGVRIEKVTFKEFRFLMSAMLFMSDDHDRDEEINDLYITYREYGDEDPVVWAREFFEGFLPDTHEMYIKNTFTALTYRKAKTNS